jgi:hypothetical protein
VRIIRHVFLRKLRFQATKKAALPPLPEGRGLRAVIEMI